MIDAILAMFVLLVNPPGHTAVDFGEARGVIGGVERKINFLAMDLPNSDAIIVVGCGQDAPTA